jgi:hypothetical protein
MVVSQNVLRQCQLIKLVQRKLVGVNSPLEGQIQVYKENSKSVSDLVGSTGVLGGHSSQAGCSDNDAHEASHVHSTPRVDLVVKPGSQRIVYHA